MPQLDIDLFDDFLFFAFVSLLFGLGDEEHEDLVIDLGIESFLAQYYLETSKILSEQKNIIKNLFITSIRN